MFAAAAITAVRLPGDSRQENIKTTVYPAGCDNPPSPVR
jgi:hypothetical protein